MYALAVLLLSWVLVFSCIFILALEVVLVIWSVAELRIRLHHLKLRRRQREYEFEQQAQTPPGPGRPPQRKPMSTIRLNTRDRRW